jgi:hypothetical protein
VSDQALNRIATAIETLAAAVAELAKAKPSNGSTPRGSSFSGASAGYDPEPTNRDGTKVGSPEDLATQYGDPEIRYIPRGWDGPDFKGLRMSQTSPTFLRWLANELGRGIEKKRAAGDDEKAGWDRKNQLRAIGWCERLGETKSAAKPDPFALTASNARDDDAGDAFSDDDIPF